MTKLAHALALAEKGFHVFPLISDSKIPAPYMTDFPNRASNDPEVVKEWWEKDPNANIAISTTRFNGKGSLIGVDVDNKNGVSGDETLLKWDQEGKCLPTTRTQHTPTGGRHLLFFSDRPVKQSASELGSGIDIRSAGGYLVGAGSVIGKKTYTADDHPIAPAPQWLFDACGEPREKSERAPVVEGINQDGAIARAIHYLEEEAPEGVAGARNDTAYKVVARIKDLGVDEVECFHLVTERWDCLPPLDDSELQSVVTSAYKRGSAPGSAAPEATFTPVSPVEGPARISATEIFLDKLHREFAVVADVSGTSLMRDCKVNGVRTIHPVSLSSLALLCMNKKVIVDGKSVTADKAWLQSANRREYDSMGLYPNGAPEGVYNLWLGWGVSPAKGEWSLIRRHIEEVLSNRDPNASNWLLRAWAEMAQKPNQPWTVATAFSGIQGSGKSTATEWFLKIFGPHALTLSDTIVLEKFNGILFNKVFAGIEEGFHSGEKRTEAKFKDLITAKKIMYERKGEDPFYGPNYLHFQITTNSEWSAPVGANERRWATFAANGAHAQDPKYFDPLYAEVENGGLSAFLYDLLRMDLTGFDIQRDRPKTRNMSEMAARGFAGVKLWLFEVLTKGDFPWVEGAHPVDWEEDGVEGTRDRIYLAYSSTSTARREYRAETYVLWRSKLAEILGGAIKDYRPREGSIRPRMIRFAPLAECRKAFEKHQGWVDHDWTGCGPRGPNGGDDGVD